MGEEIPGHEFTPADMAECDARVRQETELLGRWFDEGAFADEPPVAGCELEAWLVDSAINPLPANDTFLEKLNDANVVPELSKYNVELNTPPRPLTGSALTQMEASLTETLARCRAVAATMEAELLLTGILPTICDEHLTVAHMSSLERYRALNDQVLRLRRGKPIALNIEGADRLQSIHRDVMLEAAATSFQIHIQVPQSQAVRYYNASLIASAPMVALTANSPFLFGHDLWDETRIPLFEQAVAVTPNPRSGFNRTTFGARFVEASLFEVFQENANKYPVLLPALMKGVPEQLRHLRLQNGTIWRWNRPLIGFSDTGAPHLRIEHRGVPAGPTLADTMANAAFYFGLVYALANEQTQPETRISFPRARDNFYTACKEGLRGEIFWLDEEYVPVHELLWARLTPMAEQGLKRLGVDETDVRRYMDIVDSRLRSGQNGAIWHRRFVEKHGTDMAALARAYRDNQQTGKPVHEWRV